MLKELLVSAALTAGAASLLLAEDAKDPHSQHGAGVGAQSGQQGQGQSAADRSDQSWATANDKDKKDKEKWGKDAKGEACCEHAKKAMENDPVIQAKDPDTKFVLAAIRENTFEIEAARLVSQKVQNQQVKQLAQMMIDEHTKALEQIRQSNKGKNAQDPGLALWQKAKLGMLSNLSPKDLAEAYSIAMVGDHQVAVLKYQCAANKVQDAQLKQLAQQMIPKLQQHLQHAQTVAQAQINSPMDATASAHDAREGTAGSTGGIAGGTSARQ